MRDNGFPQTLRAISFAGKNRLSVFLELPDEKQAQALLRLSKNVRLNIITALKEVDLVKILEHLDPDEVTDLLQILPRARQKRIIKKLTLGLRESVQFLNQFDPESAAGLMSLDYIQVDHTDNFAEVAKQFKVHENRTGRLPVIFVMDNGLLKGHLPGHELGFTKPQDTIDGYIKKIPPVKHDASRDEVLQIFRSHPHNKIAVLGPKNNILGVIYSDDLLQFINERPAEHLYDFAGVKDEESIFDSVKQKVNNRYKWLIINLGTAFLAAFTVSLFEDTISKYVLLAVYMPIVAGMGGNAGTQTLAVLVRGIALKQIDLKTAWPTIKKEVASGLINGAITGLLVALVVILVNRDLKIAIVLGLAMIINLLVAGFFGALIPLVMKKLGKDPATSATIFITTATDVLGFIAFLGLATLILQ
jgi:magnesium transporter